MWAFVISIHGMITMTGRWWTDFVWHLIMIFSFLYLLIITFDISWLTARFIVYISCCQRLSPTAFNWIYQYIHQIHTSSLWIGCVAWEINIYQYSFNKLIRKIPVPPSNHQVYQSISISTQETRTSVASTATLDLKQEVENDIKWYAYSTLLSEANSLSWMLQQQPSLSSNFWPITYLASQMKPDNLFSFLVARHAYIKDYFQGLCHVHWKINIIILS